MKEMQEGEDNRLGIDNDLVWEKEANYPGMAEMWARWSDQGSPFGRHCMARVYRKSDGTCYYKVRAEKTAAKMGMTRHCTSVWEGKQLANAFLARAPGEKGNINIVEALLKPLLATGNTQPYEPAQPYEPVRVSEPIGEVKMNEPVAPTAPTPVTNNFVISTQEEKRILTALEKVLLDHVWPKLPDGTNATLGVKEIRMSSPELTATPTTRIGTVLRANYTALGLTVSWNKVRNVYMYQPTASVTPVQRTVLTTPTPGPKPIRSQYILPKDYAQRWPRDINGYKTLTAGRVVELFGLDVKKKDGNFGHALTQQGLLSKTSPGQWIPPGPSPRGLVETPEAPVKPVKAKKPRKDVKLTDTEIVDAFIAKHELPVVEWPRGTMPEPLITPLAVPAPAAQSVSDSFIFELIWDLSKLHEKAIRGEPVADGLQQLAESLLTLRGGQHE